MYCFGIDFGDVWLYYLGNILNNLSEIYIIKFFYLFFKLKVLV